MLGGFGVALLVAGDEFYALRAAWEPCWSAPWHVGVNGVTASRNGVRCLASFRVVCVHHNVFVYLASRRVWFHSLFCHRPFRHGPTVAQEPCWVVRMPNRQTARYPETLGVGRRSVAGTCL